MKRATSIICVWLLAVFVSCRNAAVTGPQTEDEILALLEAAYSSRSTQQLEILLKQWHQTVPPVDPGEVAQQSDTVQALYAIYQQFYDPFNLNKYGANGRQPEIGNNFYRGTPYVIVQDSVRYGTGERYELPAFTLKRFRPKVVFDETTTLYLTGEYANALSKFLSPEKAWEELNRRLQFLNSRLKIVPGHWIGWHFVTHPEVRSIMFEENLQKATLFFRIRYEGGEAIFERTDSGWQMISSDLTWIE
jgi:hypothetical protein